MAVRITENRKPGVGSLARSADLVSTIRSVARSAASPTGDAPAMLLLKRTGCSMLSVGSTPAAPGSTCSARCRATDPTQPGTIHSDSNGPPAEAPSSRARPRTASSPMPHPRSARPTTPDPNKPGKITSVAGSLGLPSVDSINNVYGSNALTTGGTKTAAGGRQLVSRSMVDLRYLAGVKSAIGGAWTSVFGSLTAGNATSSPKTTSW